MTRVNINLSKPDDVETCTRASAQKRQKQLDKDKAEYFNRGGKITKLADNVSAYNEH